PSQTSSSHSCPVLPTASWPHVGHLADGPTAIDAGLPCSCLVSPYPMTGDARASRTASPDRFARNVLLLPFSSRAATTLFSGVAKKSTADSAMTAHKPPSKAMLPRVASLTARYPTASAAPIQAPRLSEYSNGTTAIAVVAAAKMR